MDGAGEGRRGWDVSLPVGAVGCRNVSEGAKSSKRSERKLTKARAASTMQLLLSLGIVDLLGEVYYIAFHQIYSLRVAIKCLLVMRPNHPGLNTMVCVPSSTRAAKQGVSSVRGAM